MKYIQKKGPPGNYIAWVKSVRNTLNENYGCLRNPEKNDLHKKLLEEQGWLCAYTMKKIDLSNSHIEHIKPECICRKEAKGSDLNYRNMVACFPDKGMKSKYRYGAQAKGKWWKNGGADFVSPLDNNCEKYFRFDIEGHVIPIGRKAVVTIGVLLLNHESLAEDRMGVINDWINGNTKLTKSKTKHYIKTICDRNPDGSYTEFCIAIKWALIEYAKQLEKLAKKSKYCKKGIH
ncbi:MAG: TIGR02646 family protein [Candidatus Wallbacteria bacterium]|nr:TIGR02646 family protein [Candidatus Wallbacteria bacterium]